MKKFSGFLAAVAVVALMASPAKATTIGTISAPASGLVTQTVLGAGVLAGNEMLGALMPMTKITFTYDLVNPTGPVQGMAALTSIGYTLTNPPLYDVKAVSYAGSPAATVQPSADGVVIASAFLNSAYHGTSTIINNSKTMILNFQSSVMAYLSSGAILTGSWVASTVPLPAALPLFGASVAGLAFFRRRKQDA